MKPINLTEEVQVVCSGCNSKQLHLTPFHIWCGRWGHIIDSSRVVTQELPSSSRGLSIAFGFHCVDCGVNHIEGLQSVCGEIDRKIVITQTNPGTVDLFGEASQ